MSKYRHGGYRSARGNDADVVDFSANLNPLGPPDWLEPLLHSQIPALRHYPDPECRKLVAAAARRYDVQKKEVAVGNGSSELLYLLPKVSGKKRAVIPAPCYVDYARACEVSGLDIQSVSLRKQDGFVFKMDSLEKALRGDELVFIGQPNNPTGRTVDPSSIRRFAAKHPNTLFVIDEAFADFVEGLESLTRNRPANVIVLLSLTKNFAIPGLRLGCLVGDQKLVHKLREMQPPWSVNTLAQAVGVAALNDTAFLKKTRTLVRKLRTELMASLKRIKGISVYPGEANFLLGRITKRGLNAQTLARALCADGVPIRVCDNFEGLDDSFFRVAVRTQSENARLISSLSRHLKAGTR